jgi:signal transduction histidine kinase
MKVRVANGVSLIGGLSLALMGVLVLVFFPISIPEHSFMELITSSGERKELLSNQWNILFPIIDIFMGGLGVLNVYLIYRKKYTFAFFALSSVGAIFAFAFTLFIGLRVSYFLLLTSIIPMFFYDKTWQYLSFWVLNIALFFCAVLFINAYGSIYYTPNHLLFKSVVINMIPTFVIMFLSINYFKLENNRNEKVLHEKNTLLLAQTKEITKQHEEITKHNIELSELNATKDKFFSIIAHDLRNPFSVLIGFSGLLYENAYTYTPEEVRELSQKMLDSSNRSFNLIENLLNWSSLQRGSLKIDPEKLKPSELVQQVIVLCTQDANLKNIALSSEINVDEPIYADREMIKTVLRNLISNAIKFTYPKGQIIIRTKMSDNNLLISVSDTGRGIIEENLNKLFEIEGNLSELGTADEQGTGLGLILCKEFVDLHRGKIWVESEIGKGSIFSFTLPYV